MTYGHILRPMSWQVLKTFFWLGLTAFGGPAAHFAIFQRLLVGEGKWVSKAQYLRMLAAVNLIPGPNSTETAMLLGYARAGHWGLLLAGLGFIVPAAAVTLALVALYREVAALPLVQGTFLGLKLALAALIAQALWDLLPHPKKQPQTWTLALAGLAMAGLGVVEWAVVLLVGLLMVLGKSTKMLSVEPLGLFWFFCWWAPLCSARAMC
jgi:chromate transporter